MTLAVVVRGSDGLALAADSRVTVTAKDGTAMGYYDSATKILRFGHHPYIGAVAYGTAFVNMDHPRWLHNLAADFEKTDIGTDRISVERFAQEWGDFVRRQWAINKASGMRPQDVCGFLVAGFDEGKDFGRVFRVECTDTMKMDVELETSDDDRRFGVARGGVRNYVDALLAVQPEIPFSHLPIRECVTLAVFMVESTALMHSWITGVRLVGGPVDAAIITKPAGFKWVRRKALTYDEIEGIE